MILISLTYLKSFLYLYKIAIHNEYNNNEKLEIYAPNYDKAMKRLKSVIEYNKGK